MNVLANCKPEKVFEYFGQLCSVPHGSGNTKQVSDLCVAFAKEHGLTCRQDEYNNVIIVKEASAGYESAPAVILQGHLDMVCAAEPDCGIDMARDGLRLRVDGDWLSAEGTSLGGDDGIAVAIAMAILADDELKHPKIEAVFTTDEETGMDGAIGLDMSDLTGAVLVNLDSEEEGYLTVSCAGGVRVDCTIEAAREALPEGYVCRRVEISGLKGGHSGVEIDKGRASAMKLMGRFLFRTAEQMDLRLVSAQGGTFTNVIPLFCEAVVALPEKDCAALERLAAEFDAMFKAEYAAADPGVCLKCDAADSIGAAFGSADSGKMIFLLLDAPFGVEEMSMDIPGLVQTSANPGVLEIGETGMALHFSVRSSIASQKDMLAERIAALCTMLGGKARMHSAYPGWAYRRESELRERMARSCEKVLGRAPVITATHGGLECGLFLEKMPGLDCVSLGPDLLEVHSVRERLSIRSTERLYNIIADFLENWK